MTWTLVQASPQAATGSGTTVAPTLPAPSTAGNLLVAYLMGGPGNWTGGLPAGWAMAADVSNQGVCSASVAYYAGNPGGITSATFTRSATANIKAFMAEYHTDVTSAVVTLNARGTGLAGAVAQDAVSTGTAAASGDLAACCFTEHFTSGTAVTWTDPAGFTLVGSDGGAGGGNHQYCAHELSAAAGTLTVTGKTGTATTSANGWAGAVATFTAASPSAGTPGYVGAYVPPGPLGVSTQAQANSTWQSIMSRSLPVRRVYFGPAGAGNAMPAAITTDLQADAAAGRKAAMSLRPPFNPVSSSYLAAIDTFLKSCLGAGLAADVSLWPEPNNSSTAADGTMTAALYKAGFAYYAPTVRQYYRVVHCTSSYFDQRTDPGQAWDPGLANYDVRATDIYASEYGGGIRLDTAFSLASPAGKPCGVWECNSSTDATQGQSQAQSQAFFSYLQSQFANRLSAGLANADILLFNSNSNLTQETAITSASDYRVPFFQSLFDAVSAVATSNVVQALAGAATGSGGAGQPLAGLPPAVGGGGAQPVPPSPMASGTVPPDLARTAVALYGAAGTFAGLESQSVTLTGQPFKAVPVTGWRFGAGEAVFYSLTMGDGQIVLSTVPLTGNELQPTSDHAEIATFDPATRQFWQQVIPTSTGATVAKQPGWNVGATDAGGGDLVRVTDSSGTERCVFSCDGYYFGWDLPTIGLYPVLGALTRAPDTWRYNQVISLTGDQWHDSNPTAYSVLAASQSSGLNGTYWPTRFANQMAVLPSGNIVTGHYFGPPGHNSGLVTVSQPDGVLLAAYQIPDCNRQDGVTAVTMCPREIKADPSSAAGDERFFVLYDVFGAGGNPAPSPKGVLQEFSYNSSTQTVAPKSVPCTVTGDDAYPQYCLCAPDGTLYVSCGAVSNGLLARNVAVYLKAAGERALVTAAPATTTWATDGRYATPVQPDLSLGFTQAQGLGLGGPLALDDGHTGALLVPSLSGYLGAAVPAGPPAMGPNMISAEDGGFEGGTVGGWAGSVTTLASVTTFAAAGTHSMKMSSPFNQAIFAASDGNLVTVAAGQEYYAAASFTKDAAPPPATCLVFVNWYSDPGGATQIGSSSATTRAARVTASGTFAVSYAGVTAPAGAVRAKLMLRVTADSTVTAGQAYYVDAISFSAQPFRTVSKAEMGIAQLRSAGLSLSCGRPSISGRWLYVPWASVFTSAETAAYGSSYTPDTAHPQFLAALNIDLLVNPQATVAPLYYVPLPKAWHFITGPPGGGYDLELPQATGQTVTFRLTDAHEASFTVNAAAGYDAGLTELATDLHILRGGDVLYRGRLTSPADELTADGHQATFASMSYRGLLYRRILWDDSQLQWGTTGDNPTLVDTGSVVWGLISQTQGRAGGNLGITKGLGFPFGLAIFKKAEPGDVIGEKIDDLAYVDSSLPGAAGFDWDITARDAYTLTVDLWRGARGANRGVYLQHGDGVTGPGWSRALDTGSFADAVRMTGTATSDGLYTPPPETAEAVDIATRAEGRWDAAYSAEETSGVLLAARARLELAASQTAVPSWTIPLRPGAWQGPDHVWLGDIVHVFAGSGRLQTVERLRVIELTADIMADGEAVSLTIGQPRPDLRRRLRQLAIEIARARKRKKRGHLTWPAT